MSPASFLVMLLIMIIIPTILYSFFFLMNCPASPCAFFRRRAENSEEKVGDEVEDDKGNVRNDMELVIMSSKLGKEAECPVCLGVFLEGEELRLLKICKHLFHKSCIDKWLSTHSNCPVCRAFVSNHHYMFKEKDRRLVSGSRGGGGVRSDLWQGLPDSAGLV